jgi:diadenosine tetraphosphate (Ap4A) HIT family hydrolase
VKKIPKIKDKPCVYCNLSEIRERQILDENDLAWAFPTNIPITKGHILVVTKSWQSLD